MFSEILINDAFKGYKLKEGNELKNLSRINILIGKNNSGKSRFLRRIYSSRNIVYKQSDNETLEAIVGEILVKSNAVARELRIRGWPAAAELQRLAAIDKEGLWYEGDKLNAIVKDINSLNRLFVSQKGSSELELIDRHIGGVIRKLLAQVNEASDIASNKKTIYIPMLRGLRPLQTEQLSTNGGTMTFDGHTDNYLKRTENDYFKRTIDNGLIITGLHLYEDTKRLLLGNLDDREKIRAFEKFIQAVFFGDLPFSITPKIDDDVVHVRIGSMERPIYDLGDGIQAIIILTYPLFFYKDEHAIICFEEPETHLHPGLQRLLIDTLLRPEFNKFQYFITTHSNHFLDLTADYNEISVYTFSKETEEAEEIEIENVENEHENILQLIGVRKSSVFLSNCTIWVEGLTDRLYLRQYLKVYQQQEAIKNTYREDYHYSFVEYGGSNITHWSFLDDSDVDNPTIDVKRLCAKLFLVTDSDGVQIDVDLASGMTKTQKARRLKRLKENLGKQYYCLQCREIENLLSLDVLRKTIIGRARKGIEPKFTSAFEQEDLAQIPLGTFIKSNVTNPGRKYENGTITEKPAFCREAIKHINSITDMSPDALKLTRRIYEFIALNNTR